MTVQTMPFAQRPVVSRRAFWLLLAVAGASVLIVLVVDLIASRPAAILAECIAGAVAAAAAAVCCAIGGWRRRGAERRWRWLTGAGAILTTIGLAVSAHTAPARGTNVPALHPPDLAYLICYALAFAGLLTVPTEPQDRGPDHHVDHSVDLGDHHLVGAGRRWLAVTILDSLLMVSALALLTWELVLAPAVLHGQYSLDSVLTLWSFSLSALALLVLVFLLGAFRRPHCWPAFGLLAAGMALLTLVAVVYVAAAVRHWAVVPPPIPTGFVAAMLLIGLAAVAPPRRAGPTAADPNEGGADDRPGRLQLLHIVLPYLPLGGLGLLTVVQLATAAPIPRAEMVALVSILVLALVRQVLTLWDNASLLARYRTSQRQLLYQAFHDPLTGLANRALFNDRLRHAVDRRARDPGPQPLILLFCDLDDFKKVNDVLGHAAGDELLRLTSSRLVRAVRRVDTVARLGGDEFAILFDGSAEDPKQLGCRIAEAVATTWLLAGAPHSVRGSVGLTVVEPDVAADPEMVLHQADLAMYEAKRAGGTVTVHASGSPGSGGSIQS
ncbi:diguanylate cyclase [Pseudofrankia sp. BMG5.36]|nr:diguanylate cyclase [Pseudofrankia sp. BMG5.36]